MSNFETFIKKSICANVVCCFIVLSFSTFYLHSYFIFILFVPLYIILVDQTNSLLSKLSKLFKCFFAFNAIGSFWLCKVYFITGVSIWVANSILMTCIALICLLITKRLKLNLIYLFISFWISFEQLHNTWYLSWPWLNLGNILGNQQNIIQWYQFFGSIVGSIWILVFNYFFWKQFYHFNFRSSINIKLLVIIILPLAYSIIFYYCFDLPKSSRKISVSCFTPNIDFRYNQISSNSLIDSFFKKVESTQLKDSNLFILPENIINDGIFKNTINDSRIVNRIRNFIKQHSQHGCILGSVIISDSYLEGDNNLFNSRANVYYSKFGAALAITEKEHVYVHLKRKLIPKEEYIPHWLEWAKLQSDRLSHSNDYSNFIFNSFTITPIICYEGFFGEDVACGVNNGGQLIVLIANEQMFVFDEALNYYTGVCKIRAIENGRYFIKVSNKGLSGIIDTKGNIILKANNNKYLLFKGDVPLLSKKTLYSKIASWIHFIALLLPVFLIVFWKLKVISCKQDD